MESKKINILEYTDYRDFLKDHFNQKKSTHPQWSFGMWAKQMGLSSVSAITMIINGQRHAGKGIQDKICQYFKFQEKEERYFRELVKIQKSAKDDPSYVVLMLEQSQEIKELKGTTEDKIQLVFNWASYAIREITQLKEFKNDPEWISKRLKNKISPDMISVIIKQMIQEGVLSDEDGKLRPTNHIVPKQEINREHARQYHTDQMENGKEAFDVPFTERAFHGSTLTVKKENLAEMKDFIRDFQIKFSEKFEANPGDEVYQLNLQFFPLSKKESEE